MLENMILTYYTFALARMHHTSSVEMCNCWFLYMDQEFQLPAQIFAAKQREVSTH